MDVLKKRGHGSGATPRALQQQFCWRAMMRSSGSGRGFWRMGPGRLWVKVTFAFVLRFVDLGDL